MKKIFLILTLTAIMSVGLYAEGKGDAFVNAMGMGTAATGGGDSAATDGGTGGSGVGGATVMNSIAAVTATSTVTTATPYTYNN